MTKYFEHSGIKLTTKEKMHVNWNDYEYLLKEIRILQSRIENNSDSIAIVDSTYNDEIDKINERLNLMVNNKNKDSCDKQKILSDNERANAVTHITQVKENNLTFSEALEWMKKGRSLKRSKWKFPMSAQYLSELEKKDILKIYNVLEWDDLIATDWELIINLKES